MPNLEGTSGEICQIIQSTPQFLPQLDMAIVSGKKTLPRWVGWGGVGEGASLVGGWGVAWAQEMVQLDMPIVSGKNTLPQWVAGGGPGWGG